MLKKIKSFLKKFLPPPVSSFMREINILLSQIKELQGQIALLRKQILVMEENNCNQNKLLLERIEKESEKQNRETERQKKAFLESTTYIVEKMQVGNDELCAFKQKQSEVNNQIKIGVAGISSHLEALVEENALSKKEMQNKLDDIHSATVQSLVNYSSDLATVSETVDSLKYNASEYVSRLSSSLSEGIQKMTIDIEKVKSYAMETVWAEVFNNTISNSAWLKDKSISPGRWAIGYSGMYAIYRILNEIKPKHILELGLGQSTKLISQYVSANYDVVHYVVEHDSEWIDFFSNNYSLPEKTQLVLLEREMMPYKNVKEVRAFKDFKKTFTGKQFDLIIIDAPLGGDMPQYARVDIVELIPECLKDKFVILMDDSQRSGEFNTVVEITEKIRKANIGCIRGKYCGEKDVAIICSKNESFLVSM